MRDVCEQCDRGSVRDRDARAGVACSRGVCPWLHAHMPTIQRCALLHAHARDTACLPTGDEAS